MTRTGTEPQDRRCGHKHRTPGRTVFVCVTAPHPQMPNHHFMVSEDRADDE